MTAGKAGQHEETLTRSDLVVFLKVDVILIIKMLVSEADRFP